MTDKSRDLISTQELKLLLTICQKLLARSHPSAAVMIGYAAAELEEKSGIERKQSGHG